jgi:hypothetical protein
MNGYWLHELLLLPVFTIMVLLSFRYVVLVEARSSTFAGDGSTPSLIASVTDATFLNMASDAFYNQTSKFLYIIAGGSACFTVFNVSEAGQPTRTGAYCSSELLSGGWLMEVDSGRALAFVPALDKDRLTVLNITEPTSPRFVSSFYDDGSYIDGPLGLAIDGNFVLLTNQHSDCLVILDYMDPQSPSLEGYYCDETNLEQPQRVSK